MKISRESELLLMDLEGFYHSQTHDEAGYLKIGYGHKIIPGERFNKITKGTAVLILSEDLNKLENLINNYIPIKLKQNQFDALIIFIYNIGKTAFLNSPIFKYLRKGELEKAVIPWERWIEVNKFVKNEETGKMDKITISVPSLVKRRQIEIELFKRGLND